LRQARVALSARHDVCVGVRCSTPLPQTFSLVRLKKKSPPLAGFFAFALHSGKSATELH
jgi:hypothetical protein